MGEFTDSLKYLASAAANDRPKMSEVDFRKFLLPLIVNVDNVEKLDMSIWLDIAGNPHRSIDVYDVSNKLLFTVPPLLNRVPTEFPSKDRNGIDISSILHLYGERRRVEHPAAADAWFLTAMNGVIIEAEEQIAVDNLKALVAIYSHYNISLDKLFGGVSVQAPSDVETPTAAQSAEEQMSGEFEDL